MSVKTWPKKRRTRGRRDEGRRCCQGEEEGKHFSTVIDDDAEGGPIWLENSDKHMNF